MNKIKDTINTKSTTVVTYERRERGLEWRGIHKGLQVMVKFFL